MRVVIAAAGTGGHINPGIAIANKIKSEEKGTEVLFIGTDYGLEKDLVPRAGFELKTIHAHGLSKKLTFEAIKNNIETFKGMFEAKKILKEFKPDIVIGTGGYICGPVVMAAKSLNIPRILHESNAFPGLAVKKLGSRVNTVLVGFEDAKKRLPNVKNVVVTGTPSKMKKINMSESEKQKIKKDLGLKENLPLVLVFGGSQGARTINQAAIELILKKSNKNYQIMLAAGPKQYEEIKKELESRGKNIENLENSKILPYIYNMEEVMNACDLAICRSGAMTITEISTAGKPAIFIPLPNVSQNHQEYNARVLADRGAARIILDSNLNEQTLGEEIDNLISNKAKLQEMGKKAEEISIKNVEEQIYKEIKKIIILKK